MIAEGLVLDESVIEIAKMIAQSVIIKQMHDDGVLACNPGWLIKAVEETWPDYLFCTGTITHVVGEALLRHKMTYLELANLCHENANKYLNSLPIED